MCMPPSILPPRPPSTLPPLHSSTVQTPSPLPQPPGPTWDKSEWISLSLSLSLSLSYSLCGGRRRMGGEGRGGRRRDGVESGSGLTRTVCDARDSTMAADAPSHTPSSSSPHCGNGNLRQNRAIIQSVWYYTQNMYNIDMRTK